MGIIITGIAIVALALLLFYHRRVVRPMQTIAGGMDLLREQDFSSRLRRVGEPHADRIIDIFNRMMDELKERQLRLQERNNLLNLLVEVSPMGVVMLDFDRRIASLNPAARLFLDCDDTHIGKTLAETDSTLAKRAGTLKDGETQTFHMSDAHIYRCTCRSFPDRGFMHPFVLIESLTQDVMKAEREAYGKVIRMISHEVNNTMTSIGSIMETVSDELAEMSTTVGLQPVAATIQPIIAALQACTTRSHEMSAFITRFADVVKIPEPQLRPTPLNSLVTSSLQFIESLCNAKGIHLETDLHETQDITVNIDMPLMTQVLINIVKNSIESIMENGNANGRITISTHNSTLNTPHSTLNTPHSTLIIADNGAGIAPEAEQHLFTPFFSTKPNGHGIGLLLIREILTHHKCRFSLKTDKNKTTTFRIEF